MTLAQQSLVLADAETRTRIELAVTAAALAIVGESATANPVIDSKRHELGVRVFSGNVPLDVFYKAVVSQVGDVDPPYGTNITDTDINNAVAAVWNDVAGVKASDTVG